jgi:hypothetical protein
MQDAASTTTEQHKQYQCRHIFTDGHRCASPCLRQEEFCYYHHTTRRPVANPKQRRSRRSTFHLPLPEDRSAIQASIGEVLQRIAANDIDPRRAGLLLYGLQIASLNLPKPQAPTKPEPQTVEEITIDSTLGVLAPRTDISETATRKSPVAQLIERMMQSKEEPATKPEPATIPTLQATADDLCNLHPITKKASSRPTIFSRPQLNKASSDKSGAQCRDPRISLCRCLFSFAQPRECALGPENVISTGAKRSGEIRFSTSSLSPAALPTLTRGSCIPYPPEHRAYRQNWR